MQEWFNGDIAMLSSISYDTLFDYDNLKKDGRTPMDETVDVTPELDRNECNDTAGFRIACKDRQKGIISCPYTDIVFDMDYINEVVTEKTHDLCTCEREFGLRIVLR